MENKICSSCKTEKELTDFHKRTKSKGGFDSQCKLCINAQRKLNKKPISDELKKYKKEWYLKNKERTGEHSKEVKKIYRETNGDKINQKNKEYRELNKDKSKAYYEANKEQIKAMQKQFRQDNWALIRQREKEAQIKKRQDPFYKLKDSVRNRIRASIKSKGYNKNSKTLEILGCSFEEFKNHIESLFESWMTWDNYGNPKDGIIEPDKTWDLDHIIPIAKSVTEDDVINLNHYINLQPLCSYINRKVKRDN